MNRLFSSRYSTILFFLALLFLSFLLRIFYSGHLFEDDGLWFTAAEEMLRGRALYREIYFDKPPALPILYALLFKLFGTKIIVIRVFTVFYSVVVAWMLYRFGARLYGRREGLIAAAAFIVFSTTYLTGHMQGLNTDFLMTLPYAAGAYFFVRSCMDLGRRWFALLGGMLTGVAFNINPKGVFDLVFFVMLIAFAGYLGYRRSGSYHAETERRRDAEDKEKELSDRFDSSRLNSRSAVRLISLALTGFIAGSLPFLIYLVLTKSLSAYWTDVWVWGSRYAGYFPASVVVMSGLKYVSAYFLVNGALFVTLVIVITSFIKKVRKHTLQTDWSGSRHFSTSEVFADGALLIWFVVSMAGLIMGGRFYGHYFFQILPALCLIGGRGLSLLLYWMKSNHNSSRLKAVVYQSIFALLILGALVSIIRFHTRTVALAYEFFSGRKSDSTKEWYHEQLNREELLTAAAVRDIKDRETAIDNNPVEFLRKDSPRTRPPEGQKDYLFVWGYRPELYYWSGLIPASRYLSTQMLTGVPADVHYAGDDARMILDESFTSRARTELVQELEAVRPKYIVDEVGMFNNELGIMRYAELGEFMKAYKRMERVERFLIYQRRDMRKKKKKKKDRLRIQSSATFQEPAR